MLQSTLANTRLLMDILEGYLKRAEMLFFHLTAKKRLKTENGYLNNLSPPPKKRMFQVKLDHRKIPNIFCLAYNLKKNMAYRIN